MSFTSSDVLPMQLTTINESVNPVEVSSSPPFKASAIPITPALAPAPAPVFKLKGSDAIFSTTRTSDAIFSVVPINIDSYGPYGKPNAIVRPVRRNEPNEMTLPHAANEVTAAAAAVATAAATVTAVNQPASNQSTPKYNVPGINKKQDIDTFTKELENKLRHLHKEKRVSIGNANGGLVEQTVKRPRFFTTVPCGVYLPPAKDLPAAPKVRHPRTYAYFSIPKIFAQNIDKDNKVSPITQIHAIKTSTSTTTPFGKSRESLSQPQNIMYDKRVVRGSNYSHMHMQAWNPYFAYAGLLSGKGDVDVLSKESEAERRQLLRKRYSNRNKRSVIGTPPPIKGRRHEIVQTDRYLEELLVNPTDYSVECQTDLYLYEIPNAPYVSSKSGIDAATEIDANELYDFDEEVQPIVDALIEMTMAQALNEYILEEEMAELQRDTENYMAFRKLQNSGLKRLDTIQRHDINDDADGNGNGSNDPNNDPMDDEINAAKLLHSYVTAKLPDILATVNTELNDKHLLNIVVDGNIQPWLAHEIASEVGQMIDSRDSLEKLVKNIVENRAENYLKQEIPNK